MVNKVQPETKPEWSLVDYLGKSTAHFRKIKAKENIDYNSEA